VIARRSVRDLDQWLEDAEANDLRPFVSLSHGIQAAVVPKSESLVARKDVVRAWPRLARVGPVDASTANAR
jgi:hypothetical protein